MPDQKRYNQDKKVEEYDKSLFCPICGGVLIKMGGCMQCMNCDYEKCDI
jgi:hypothetical protein